jgi:hypothetical protein
MEPIPHHIPVVAKFTPVEKRSKVFQPDVGVVCPVPYVAPVYVLNGGAGGYVVGLRHI